MDMSYVQELQEYTRGRILSNGWDLFLCFLVAYFLAS